MCSGRLILIMANTMLFYLLTAQTMYLQENHFGLYLKEFKWFYVASLAAISVDLVAGLATVASVRQNNDQMALIKKPWFQPFSVITQLLFALQVIVAMRHSAFVLHKRHWQLS